MVRRLIGICGLLVAGLIFVPRDLWLALCEEWRLRRGLPLDRAPLKAKHFAPADQRELEEAARSTS